LAIEQNWCVLIINIVSNIDAKEIKINFNKIEIVFMIYRYIHVLIVLFFFLYLLGAIIFELRIVNKVDQDLNFENLQMSLTV